MKKTVQSILGLVILLLVLMVGVGLVAKSMLSGSRIQSVLGEAESRLGVKISASGGDFDLVQWFLLQPTVAIRDLSIGNPPGFSSQSLLQTQQVSAQIVLLSLWKDHIDVRRFILHQPRLTIERDASGGTNLQALLRRISGEESAEPATESNPGGRRLSVESFLIESGTVDYVGPGSDVPSFSVDDVDLSVEGFSPDASSRVNLQARLFGSESSELAYQGQAGPFLPQSVAAEGDLSANVAPAEIPAELREEYLGDLLGDPGSAARLTFAASMKGDLMETFQGTGKLQIADFQIGKDETDRIALRGEAPLQITVEKALTDPKFRLLGEKASLQLGEGTWQGGVDFRFDGQRFQGSSSGSMAEVRINEMLAALAAMDDKVYGVAEIPQYQIRFAGANARQIRESLQGTGRLTIGEGRIAFFDLFSTIEQKAKQLLAGESPKEGATNFVRFQTSFAIQDQQVRMADLLLESAEHQVTGQGYVTFDEALHFDLVAQVGGTLASLIGGKPNASGQLRSSVPVKVRGTTESPKVSVDLVRKAVETVTDLLDSLFKKKTTKEQPQQ